MLRTGIRILFVLLPASAVLNVSHAAASTDHTWATAQAYQVRGYRVPAAQITQYWSTSDQQMSPFWLVWSNPSTAGAVQMVDLDWQDHFTWGEAATGETDVDVNIRFAFSDNGVYLLYEVQDDNWVGWVNEADYTNDAVELFGNQYSAQELYENASSMFPCLSYTGGGNGFPNQLNENYFQIQIRFGGPELVEVFSMNWWRPDMLGNSNSCAPGSGGDGFVQYNRAITLAEANSTYGLQVEILPQQGAWRRQEWFIPWSAWGGPNPPGLTSVPSNNKVAICVGYNDLDAGVQLQPTALRWRQCDPYGINGTQVGESLDCWGELVCDGDLQDVLDDAGVSWSQIEATRSAAPRPFRADLCGDPKKAEFFTVTGQRLGQVGVSRHPAGRGVVVRRVASGDNTVSAVRVSAVSGCVSR